MTELQAQGGPELVHAAADLRVHDDRAAPAPPGFAGPLAGRVDAHLRAQAGYRAGEVEVIDRGVGDERGVALRIDARADRPYHLFPVADVDVLVAHHHELGVHELAQIAPYAEHDALGVAGILLAHAHHRQPVRAGLGRQVEVDDLGE